MDVRPLRGGGVCVGQCGDEKWAGDRDGREPSGTQEEPQGRAPAHLTGLCSVATGSGLSWDSGAAARLGESPASMGNLRTCGGSWALMSRTPDALRGEERSGHSRASGRPLPAPTPWVVAHLPEAEAGPRLEAAA